MLQRNLKGAMRTSAGRAPARSLAIVRAKPANNASASTSGLDASRRAVVLGAPLLLAGLVALPVAPVMAEEVMEAMAPVAAAATSTAGKMSELVDPILAYKFKYPVETLSGKPLKMLLAHEPEKYSSAAPLTADARQRIVSEYLDLRNFVTVSITVGPASGVLTEIDVEEWKPIDVALTVLIDRSTSRVSTGQRVAMNDVEDAYLMDKPDGRFYVYEHQSQGSPTPGNVKRETFRHALAATTMRKGGDGVEYLYTLNLSCREDMWPDLYPLFKESVDSFALTAPTDAFVSPEVNSWQFWLGFAEGSSGNAADAGSMLGLQMVVLAMLAAGLSSQRRLTYFALTAPTDEFVSPEVNSQHFGNAVDAGSRGPWELPRAM
eukprot:gene3868-13931_t